MPRLCGMGTFGTVRETEARPPPPRNLPTLSTRELKVLCLGRTDRQVRDRWSMLCKLDGRRHDTWVAEWTLSTRQERTRNLRGSELEGNSVSHSPTSSSFWKDSAPRGERQLAPGRCCVGTEGPAASHPLALPRCPARTTNMPEAGSPGWLRQEPADALRAWGTVVSPPVSVLAKGVFAPTGREQPPDSHAGLQGPGAEGPVLTSAGEERHVPSPARA